MNAPTIMVDALLALVAAVQRLRNPQIDEESNEGEGGLLEGGFNQSGHHPGVRLMPEPRRSQHDAGCCADRWRPPFEGSPRRRTPRPTCADEEQLCSNRRTAPSPTRTPSPRGIT